MKKGGGVENGHSGVFFERFGDNIFRGDGAIDVSVDFLKVFLVGNQIYLRGRNNFLATFYGLEKQGVFTKNGEELFGIVGAGKRPKTGAGAATEDYNKVFWCCSHNRLTTFLKFNIKMSWENFLA